MRGTQEVAEDLVQDLDELPEEYSDLLEQARDFLTECYDMHPVEPLRAILILIGRFVDGDD